MYDTQGIVALVYNNLTIDPAHNNKPSINLHKDIREVITNNSLYVVKYSGVLDFVELRQ